MRGLGSNPINQKSSLMRDSWERKNQLSQHPGVPGPPVFISVISRDNRGLFWIQHNPLSLKNGSRCRCSFFFNTIATKKQWWCVFLYYLTGMKGSCNKRLWDFRHCATINDVASLLGLNLNMVLTKKLNQHTLITFNHIRYSIYKIKGL